MALRWGAIPLCAAMGCSIGVNGFQGTVLQMTLEVSASAPGHHLELWARDSYDDVLRINGSFLDNDTQKTFYPYGLQVQQAISLDDPCMIDDKGNLLTTAAAYPSAVFSGGVPQTPEMQAETVVNRIKQLLSIGQGGFEGSSLLAIVPWKELTPPSVPASASAADRLAACKAYWSDPLAYTPNPAQVTAPLHGTVYGFVGYSTMHPPAGYDGLRIDSPIALKGIRELWLTDETRPAGSAAGSDFVDPKHRGPTALDGVPDHGGRDVVHFDLTGPAGAGTAALLVNLDQDPTQY